MPKNRTDLPPDKEPKGAAVQPRADVARCRYQELAEAENRFRKRQNREQRCFEPAAAQTNEPSDGIERSAQRTIEKEVNRYSCKGDDGSLVTIVEYQHFLETREHARTRSFPGSRRLALENGEAVRRIDGETFEAIQTGEMIRTRAGQV